MSLSTKYRAFSLHTPRHSFRTRNLIPDDKRPLPRCRQPPAPLISITPFHSSFSSHSSQPPKSPTTTTGKMSSSTEKTAEFESKIQRNPHPDFKAVEASRPPFQPSSSFHYTQTPSPNWKFGSGASISSPSSVQHRVINPYAADRPAHLNYKLLISTIIPRPIALVSTRSTDGKVTNLAPFSYFNTIGHDPPLFIIGFASTHKDSLNLLKESGECTINIISEGFIEAANSTSVNAPLGVSEWEVSGLTEVYDCEEVKCARVKEAVFSIEGKLESVKEFESRSVKGKVGTTLVVVEGVRFWAREDGINEEGSLIDPGLLRAVGRLGGITYGRVGEGWELPRVDWGKDLGGSEGWEGRVRRN